jgi:hypothetical protein
MGLIRRMHGTGERYRDLVRKAKGMRPLGKPRHRRDDNIVTYFYLRG